VNGAARPFFVRGVNVGAAPAGHFPGEFAIQPADYRRWLQFVRRIHANAIRVYALHPPALYQALLEENAAHPEDPIWLFQEVWTELPGKNDFWDPSFTQAFDVEIRTAVDALHGHAVVAPRPGHASGAYTADVSRYIAGWLLGREWEPYAVRVTERRHPETTSFLGSFFEVQGTAMECWLARSLDGTASYEARKYGLARAVAFVNWPTLDPMRHPTETERGGRESEHDEDAYSVDPLHIRPLRGASPLQGTLGYFANYHVYPYYPDFMNLDPGYSSFRDRHGICNYAGYLTDLKAHTRGLPLLIGEMGVPTSRGIAHLQPQGIDHGGMSEEEQGRYDVRLIEDVVDTGCSGALLFSLFDEWFKVNWLVARMERPRDRDPLWHNLLDPEECYGLLGFDPPPRIQVDGRADDWSGIAPYAADPKGAMLRGLYVTSDQSRLYLRLDLAPRAPAAAVGIALDVLDPARGDRRLPAPLDVTWSRGAEFAIVVEPGAGRAELYVDRSMNFSGWSRLLVNGVPVADRAPFRPVANEDGRYAPLLLETNRERVSKSGRVYPAQHLDWGRLARGEEPANADWALDPAAGTIEIALPWGLLNVGDPSSLAVIDDDPSTPAVETSRTSGIGLLAWGTRARAFRADSLGPALPGFRGRVGGRDVQILGPPGTTQTHGNQGVRVVTPEGASYVWNGWEMPITQERIKRSSRFIRDAYEGMEAREKRTDSESNARN